MYKLARDPNESRAAETQAPILRVFAASTLSGRWPASSLRAEPDGAPGGGESAYDVAYSALAAGKYHNNHAGADGGTQEDAENLASPGEHRALRVQKAVGDERSRIFEQRKSNIQQVPHHVSTLPGRPDFCNNFAAVGCL
jgi:hypothetical protein